LPSTYKLYDFLPKQNKSNVNDFVILTEEVVLYGSVDISWRVST